jgi:riboflavin synthase
VFTGLVQCLGKAVSLRQAGDEAELAVDLAGIGTVRVGDSVALSGCCCTVARLSGSVAGFDLSSETLARTWLPRLRPGDPLNLEPALRAGDQLGGHLVQGHVDGLGRIERPCGPAGGFLQVRLEPAHVRYCVEKGSIALDGVSLTIAAVAGGSVTLAIIPHTAAVTTLGSAPAGAALHVEVDVIAKYVERLVGPYRPAPP